MLMEATILGLAVLTWKKLGKREEWTAEREAMYQSALENLTGPLGVNQLLVIAKECDEKGFHVKAYGLRQRAKLRAQDVKTKQAHREAFRKGMQSDNVEGILRLAAAFERYTATGAAARLRARAEWIVAGKPAAPQAPQPSTQGPPPAHETAAAPQVAPVSDIDGLPPEAEVGTDKEIPAEIPVPERVAKRIKAAAQGKAAPATALPTPALEPQVVHQAELVNGANGSHAADVTSIVKKEAALVPETS